MTPQSPLGLHLVDEDAPPGYAQSLGVAENLSLGISDGGSKSGRDVIALRRRLFGALPKLFSYFAATSAGRVPQRAPQNPPGRHEVEMVSDRGFHTACFRLFCHAE
jgi:hypothetical protein